MLSHSDKEKIRKSIKRQIDASKSEIEELVKLQQYKILNVAPDSDSHMDFLKNSSANDAAIREAQTRLLKLKYALSLIDKSGLGTCIRCGNIIPFQRLLSIPDITKCASCA